MGAAAPPSPHSIGDDATQATFSDAAAGWEIFRETEGQASRDEINAALTDRGYNPISKRTVTHYRKLLRLGYTEYVSINRLDLRHSNESVFDVADRSRYRDRPYSNCSAGLLVRAVCGGLPLGARGVVWCEACRWRNVSLSWRRSWRRRRR
jgi:hypothetical protein